MDEPCSREVLRACLRDIARTNRWTLGYRPVFHWLNEVAAAFAPLAGPLRILDVGCGYGDLLRRVEQWAHARGLAVELTRARFESGRDGHRNGGQPGVEPNQVGHRGRAHLFSATAAAPGGQFPVHASSSEEQIIRFLRWMEEHAQLGWFINDLSRAPDPVPLVSHLRQARAAASICAIRWCRSIARSFLPAEWQSLCAAAGLRDETSRFAPSSRRGCAWRGASSHERISAHHCAPGDRRRPCRVDGGDAACRRRARSYAAGERAHRPPQGVRRISQPRSSRVSGAGGRGPARSRREGDSNCAPCCRGGRVGGSGSALPRAVAFALRAR